MGQLEMCGSSGEMRWDAHQEAAGKGLRGVQLVLTSHSTHIAPEGGAAFIKPV